MAFLPSMSPTDIHDYHRVVARSAHIRSHFDLLVWLQGDLQRYLPHQLLIASWGNFVDGTIHHDLLTATPGVSEHGTRASVLGPMLRGLFTRWVAFQYKPFALSVNEKGFFVEKYGSPSPLGQELGRVRSVLVHGIKDERGNQDCLYAAFSTDEERSDAHSTALSLLMPHIDMALRQVAQQPAQAAPSLQPGTQTGNDMPGTSAPDALSEREAEILSWVAMGKTNADIGMILGISEFTVKNHLQRVFKKLDVNNRAQAVSRLNALLADV
ncbi:MAG: transcriptional regulator EpsA [Pseudomonadota bacterium]|jgi:transcriptional regulator EpsA